MTTLSKYLCTIKMRHTTNDTRRIIFLEERCNRVVAERLIRELATDDPNSLIRYFGSYHYQYWLDGKLLAVGVIDILPLCLSSVYFFYDPDYNDLGLGTYSSIKEIQLVRELQKFLPSLEYYYLGYYINSCVKMKYKARIKPSYLLCPETYTWCPIEEALQKISLFNVCRLNSDPTVTDELESVDVDNVTVLVGYNPMKYRDYKMLEGYDDDIDEVTSFARAVGQKCAYSLLLYRD